MKYTFQMTDRVDFLCSKCFHRNELTFNTEVSGDPEEAIPPRICIPYSHASNIRCGKCGGKMFAVDRHIGKFIQQLNLMGYKTKSCCEGHKGHHPVNPQVIGINMKQDEKMSSYSSREHDFIKEAQSAKTFISIDDIKGLPENEEYMDAPFVMFSHRMEDLRKRFLMGSLETVLKNYDCFCAYVYPCNKHGTILNRNEVKIGESEFSLVVIESDKDYIAKYIEENHEYPDLTYQMQHLLGDLIIEFDRISNIEHKEVWDE